MAEEATTTEVPGDFEAIFGQDPDYLNADPVTQERYRTVFQQNVEEAALADPEGEHQQAIARNQATADRQNFAENFAGGVVDSHVISAMKALTIDDALLRQDGTVDHNYATDASKLWKKQDEQPITRGKKALAASMAQWNKTVEQGGESVGSYIEATADFLIDLPGNWEGVMDVAADSSASLTTMGVGGAVGSVVPVVGTAIGAFVAELSDAGAAKFNEQMRTAMEGKGMGLTPANVRQFVRENPEAIARMQVDALKYGGVLGAVDVALGGFFGRIAGLPSKMARQTALKGLTKEGTAALAAIAKKEGVSVAKLTKNIINGKTPNLSVDMTAAQILKNRSFKQKIKTPVTSYLGEVAGEPTSEAAATASIGEENTFENLAYETLGGIGAGPYGTAINTAMFGTKLATKPAADKAADLIDKIKNPRSAESKAARATQRDQRKVLKKQRQARTESRYKATIGDIAPDSPEVDVLADYTNVETFNPVKAIDILAEADASDMDSHIKALEIDAHIAEQMDTTADSIRKLEAKQKDGKLKATEKEDLNALYATLKELEGINAQIGPKMDLINKKAVAAAEAIEVGDIDLDNASEDDVVEHVIKILGSSKSANETIGQLKAIADKGGLNESNGPFLKAVLDSAVAEQNLETARAKMPQRKGSKEVRDDIMNGEPGSGFLGIQGYATKMNILLDGQNKPNFAGGNKLLESFKGFAEKHRAKYEQMNEIYEARKAGKKTLTPTQQANFDAMAKRSKNPNFRIDKGSKNLINLIGEEASALEAALKVQEAYFNKRHAEGGKPRDLSKPKRKPTNKPGTNKNIPAATEGTALPTWLRSAINKKPVADIIAAIKKKRLMWEQGKDATPLADGIDLQYLAHIAFKDVYTYPSGKKGERRHSPTGKNGQPVKIADYEAAVAYYMNALAANPNTPNTKKVGAAIKAYEEANSMAVTDFGVEEQEDTTASEEVNPAPTTKPASKPAEAAPTTSGEHKPSKAALDLLAAIFGNKSMRENALKKLKGEIHAATFKAMMEALPDSADWKSIGNLFQVKAHKTALRELYMKWRNANVKPKKKTTAKPKTNATETSEIMDMSAGKLFNKYGGKANYPMIKVFVAARKAFNDLELSESSTSTEKKNKIRLKNVALKAQAALEAWLENKNKGKGKPKAKTTPKPASTGDLSIEEKEAIVNKAFDENNIQLLLDLPNGQQVYDDFVAALKATPEEKINADVLMTLFQKTGNKVNIITPVSPIEEVTPAEHKAREKVGIEFIDRISGRKFYLVNTNGAPGYPNRNFFYIYDSNKKEIGSGASGYNHKQAMQNLVLTYGSTTYSGTGDGYASSPYNAIMQHIIENGYEVNNDTKASAKPASTTKPTGTKKISNKKKQVAVIGTAGRDEDKPMTKALWDRMYEQLKGAINKNHHLVSGGAAWADHLAVRAFNEGLVSGLTLHLPAPIKNGRYVGAFGTAGSLANYFISGKSPFPFNKIMGIDAVAEIELAIANGATVTYEPVPVGKTDKNTARVTMFARNAKVAKTSDSVIAFTFGEGDTVNDGGTKNTWGKINSDEKIHFPLGEEEQTPPAKPAATTSTEYMTSTQETYAPIDDIPAEMNIETVLSDSKGNTALAKYPAKKALTTINKKIEILEQLLECIS